MSKIPFYCALLFGVFGLPKARNYVDNGDGTISDLVTGLTWEKNMGDSVTWADAMSGAETATTGGYTDWRMPTLKELFSLILYSGQCFGENHITFFIDEQFFDHPLGDTSAGEREIEAQTWSSTTFDGYTMNNDRVEVTFGVNFVDGRVKAYPVIQEKYARYVRGSSAYGSNNFVNNNDETISDLATGLMWAESDSGTDLDWEGALAYAEHTSLAGYSDWRLPTIKELNSIVSYNNSQGEPAIDESVFQITEIEDMEGEDWYPYFWSSSTLLDGPQPGSQGVYQAFGRALGTDFWSGELMDAHGAGAVRGDPKSGDMSEYPKHTTGFQGDVQYVYNYVRLVRDIESSDEPLTYQIVETDTTVCYDDTSEMSSCPSSGEPFYGQDGNWQPEDLEEVDIAVVTASDENVEISSTQGSAGVSANSGMLIFGIVAAVCLLIILVVIIGICCWYSPDNSSKPVQRAENIPIMHDPTQNRQPGQIPMQPYSQQFPFQQRSPIYTDQVGGIEPVTQWSNYQPMPFHQREFPPERVYQPGAYTQFSRLPQR